MARLAIVVVVVVIVGATWAFRRWSMRQAQRFHDGERLPSTLLDGSRQRTWVLVTAPTCTACGSVEQRLRELDPHARLVVVDAAERPDLARALRARAAPTVLLAGPDGAVQRRLAGSSAVDAGLEANPATAGAAECA